MLDEELSKDNADYDRVAEITASIRETADGENSPPESDRDNIEKILSLIELKKRQKIKKIKKTVSAVSACFAIGFSLNLCSLSVFGTNIIDSALNITRNGFKINLFDGSIFHPVTTAFQYFELTTTTSTFNLADGNETTVSTEKQETQISEDINISDIIADYCYKNGLDGVLIPSNLTSLNVPTEIQEQFAEESGLSKDIYMTFSDSKRKLNVTIEKYYDRNDIPNVLIPADTDGTSVETLSVQGIKVHIFEYEKYSSAVYASGDTVYTLTYFNVPDGKMYEIAGSLTYYIAGSEGR